MAIVNINREEADVTIFDEIGGFGVSGQAFADEIQQLNDFGVKKITVHINSFGGAVIDGFSIFSAMRNSNAEINVIIEGIAASMAGIVALAGDTIAIVDFGSIMVHGPSGSSDPDENEQNMLDQISDQLAIILVNRTNKTKSEITEILNSDKDTLLDAKEALAEGFVDEIIETKDNKHLKRERRKRMAANEIAAVLKTDEKPTFSLDKIKELITKAVEAATPKKSTEQNTDHNTKITNMKQLLASLLGLQAEASDTAFVNAVKDIFEQKEKLEKELSQAGTDLKTANDTIKTHEDKIKEFEGSIAKSEEEEIKQLVEQAHTDGKIDKKQIEPMIEANAGNVKGLRATLGGLKNPALTITDQLSGKSGGSEVVMNDERKAWGWRKWEESDPKGFAALKLSSPEYMNELHKKEYNGKNWSGYQTTT